MSCGRRYATQCSKDMSSKVPLIGDVLVLLAGAARMPVWRFMGWTTLGKGARYVAVALAIDRF